MFSIYIIMISTVKVIELDATKFGNSLTNSNSKDCFTLWPSQILTVHRKHF